MRPLTRETVLGGLSAADRIRQGELPTADELAAAPVMAGWALEEVYPGLHRLVGMVQGHPIIPDGYCTTSVVLVMAPDQTWARTVSRVYTLKESLVRSKFAQ